MSSIELVALIKEIYPSAQTEEIIIEKKKYNELNKSPKRLTCSTELVGIEELVKEIYGR